MGVGVAPSGSGTPDLAAMGGTGRRQQGDAGVGIGRRIDARCGRSLRRRPWRAAACASGPAAGRRRAPASWPVRRAACRPGRPGPAWPRRSRPSTPCPTRAGSSSTNTTRRIGRLAQQRQAGLRQPPRRGQVDVHRARERGRVGLLPAGVRPAKSAAQCSTPSRRPTSRFEALRRVRRSRRAWRLPGRADTAAAPARPGVSASYTRFNFGSLRPSSTTVAPARAQASAAALPRPPCAPVTSTTRPSSARAALRRPATAAHWRCVSLIMRASSPDSNSSRVMSQPPISSPWMNSCGNVGQFE